MKTTSTETPRSEQGGFTPSPAVLAAWCVLAAAFVWFYYSSIAGLANIWWKKEDYQHGFFVPIFSVALLWMRRDMLVPFKGRGSWWGLAFVAIWASMLWAAAFFKFESLPEMSMLPFFAGVALFVGGWQGLHWAWPSIVFLAFMIPLPGMLQGFLSIHLQRIAAVASGFIIQTLGMSAMVVGHTIQLVDISEPLDVATACSGLRMMTLAFALCIGAAFILKRPLWEKLVLILSAAPIAVAANVTRIVLTALLYGAVHRWPTFLARETAEKIIHNGAGYVMPIFGLFFLWLELRLLSKLFLEPLPDRPLIVGRMAVKQENAPQQEKTEKTTRR